MHERRLGSVTSCAVLLFLLCQPVLAHNGVLAVAPELGDITIDGEKRTAIRLRVEDRVPVPDGDDVVALDDPVVEAAIALDG